MYRLNLQELSISNGRSKEHDIVSGVNLSVEPGRILGILGPNGCGKTSLIMAVLGFIPVSGNQRRRAALFDAAWGDERRRMRGRIIVDDEDVTEWSPGLRGMSFVPQNLALFPDKSVLENLAFPLLAKGLDRESARKQASDLAARLDLTSVATRRPAEISGGQQQRVAIGRAIIHKPKLVCLDEPTASLDALSRREVLAHVYDVLRESNACALFVSHDPRDAELLCDEVAFIHDGHVQQVATPQEAYDNPSTLFVARMFSGYANAVAGQIDKGGCFRPEGSIGGWEIPPGIRCTISDVEGPAWLAGRPVAFAIGVQGDGGVVGTVVGRWAIEGRSYTRVEVSPGVVLSCFEMEGARHHGSVVVQLKPKTATDVKLFEGRPECK
jgi:ABC-type sugar transport system ATPase subunit